jgi:hypothetical protein
MAFGPSKKVQDAVAAKYSSMTKEQIAVEASASAKDLWKGTDHQVAVYGSQEGMSAAFETSNLKKGGHI